MAAAQEKTLAHSRSCDQNLQRGWGFIQNGSYGEKSEKIWVRDMAKVKINKMAEKAEVQFKKKEGKKTSFACTSFRNTAKCYRSCFCCSVFLFVILKLGVMDLSVLDCGTLYR